MKKSSEKSNTKLEDMSNKQVREYSDFLIQTVDDVQEQMKKRISRYKPVAGRKKLSPGKKARAENKGSTEFEWELVSYLKWMDRGNNISTTFRSPASKTPVDVYHLGFSCLPGCHTIVSCYQCKTTRDTKPPKINKKEFEEFCQFVYRFRGFAYWVDRWKKNKNVYIRRIRAIDLETRTFEKVFEDEEDITPEEADFSPILNIIKAQEKKKKKDSTSPVDRQST